MFRRLRPLRLALPLLATFPVSAAESPPSLEERVRRLESLVAALQQENAALRAAATPTPATPPPAAAAPSAPRPASAPASAASAPAQPAAAGSPVTLAPGPASLRISGDVRARLVGTWYPDPAGVARDQLLMRVRLGLLASFEADFEAGVRLSAGDASQGFGGSPLSAQFSGGDNSSRKPALFDLAFLRWRPLLATDTRAAFTVGKSANLFFTPSRILFDNDYNPEGFTAETTLPVAAAHRLHLAAGLYLLDDLAASARDPGLAAARARWEAAWTPAWTSSVGVMWLGISHPDTLTAANIANLQRGNTRTAAGVLVHGYRPLHTELTVTRTVAGAPAYPGPFPVTLRAEFLHNPAAPAARDGWVAGIAFGQAGRAGRWSVAYQLMEIEADAWFEEMLDADNGAFYRRVPPGWNTDPASLAGGHGGGTGIRSHSVRTSWSPRDFLTLNANLHINNLLRPLAANPGADGRARRLQFETLLRF